MQTSSTHEAYQNSPENLKAVMDFIFRDPKKFHKVIVDVQNHTVDLRDLHGNVIDQGFTGRTTTITIES